MGQPEPWSGLRHDSHLEVAQPIGCGSRPEPSAMANLLTFAMASGAFYGGAFAGALPYRMPTEYAC